MLYYLLFHISIFSIMFNFTRWKWEEKNVRNPLGGWGLHWCDAPESFTLYIVPLQDELDLSPLPANAPEFALMPKASCKHCFAEMPLQMLALHDRKCASHTSPDLEVNFFSRIWDIKCLKLTVYGYLKLEMCFNLIDYLWWWRRWCPISWSFANSSASADDWRGPLPSAGGVTVTYLTLFEKLSPM